jgi:hypothetical protein
MPPKLKEKGHSTGPLGLETTYKVGKYIEAIAFVLWVSFRLFRDFSLLKIVDHWETVEVGKGRMALEGTLLIMVVYPDPETHILELICLIQIICFWAPTSPSRKLINRKLMISSVELLVITEKLHTCEADWPHLLWGLPPTHFIPC